MRLHVLRPFAGALSLFLSGASAVFGATYEVASIADLQTRISAAIAGDRIVVKNGVYTTSGSISVNRAGAADAWITIAAETLGGVEIAGTHGFSMSSPAAYIVIEGFRFTHRNSISISSSAHHIRLTRNIIELTIPAGSDTSYVNISGNDVEIDRNELRNKTTLGNMLDVTGSGSQVARRLWVHHNYFHDFTSPGGNGAETIRLGLSGLSLSTGDAIVEYNLFTRCNGENELISNKSSGNIYRFNTIIDSPGAQLTLRHGDDCIAYGNYFKNTDGLRVYGDRHQIFSNYFEGNTKGIDMGNGDGDVHGNPPAALTAHDRPDDCIVVFNTFINNTVHYQMGGRTNGLGALNITVANNIMQGPGNAANVSSTAPHTGTWSGNLLWNVTSPGNMPASGYTIADPKLAPGADGVHHLQAGSPAIDASEGSFGFVTHDLDGQPRSGAKDKGADEYSAAPIVARLLTPADVGPSSGLGGAPVITTHPTAPATPDAGDRVVLTVDATGGNGSTLAYQWFHDSVPIAGATEPTLTLGSVQSFDAGMYYAIVSSPGGWTASTAASLAPATPPASGALLANLSTRGFARTGADVIIPGFVIGGSGNKRVLLRTVGPGLQPHGVNDFLPNPRLSLARLSGGNFVEVATNDNWSTNANAATIVTTSATIGAFALTDGSTDAALLLDLPPGIYTAIADDASGANGVVLAELYDASLGAGGARLVNISTRGFISTGGRIMIPGFVVSSEGPKTLLIRAVGPGLANVGIASGWIADPELVVYRFVAQGQPDELILRNDNWGVGADATRTAQVAAQVGAFALTNGSTDAAFVVTLEPGIYTVHASGVGGVEGLGLVEIYEVN